MFEERNKQLLKDAQQYIDETRKNKAFNQHKLNGVALTFPNGNWISTIWNDGAYCENHWLSMEDPFFVEMGMEKYNIIHNVKLKSDAVEIMIRCGEKLSKRIHKKYDGDGSVIGYLNIMQWLQIINLLAKEKHDKKIQKSK
jgi:hypothetical protein